MQSTSNFMQRRCHHFASLVWYWKYGWKMFERRFVWWSRHEGKCADSNTGKVPETLDCGGTSLWIFIFWFCCIVYIQNRVPMIQFKKSNSSTHMYVDATLHPRRSCSIKPKSCWYLWRVHTNLSASNVKTVTCFWTENAKRIGCGENIGGRDHDKNFIRFRTYSIVPKIQAELTLPQYRSRPKD